MSSDYNNKYIGNLGEDIAACYLERKGQQIIGRNYRKKYGEIDIITKDSENTVHFVEVKAVSYETKAELDRAVTRRTWRPEEKVDSNKIRHIQRVAEVWLSEHTASIKWQIDVVVVKIVTREKYSTVKLLPNIILD